MIYNVLSGMLNHTIANDFVSFTRMKLFTMFHGWLTHDAWHILNPLLMTVWWHTLQMHKVERGLLSASSTRSSSVAGDSIASEIGKKVRIRCFLPSLASLSFIPFSRLFHRLEVAPLISFRQISVACILIQKKTICSCATTQPVWKKTGSSIS